MRLKISGQKCETIITSFVHFYYPVYIDALRHKITFK